jgi:hypothetical protein
MTLLIGLVAGRREYPEHVKLTLDISSLYDILILAQNHADRPDVTAHF